MHFMSKRHFLIFSVASLFTCLFLAFAWVFFNGLFIKSATPVATDKLTQITGRVPVGEVAMRRYKNQAIWVVHLSAAQLTVLKEIEPYVFNPKLGCDLNKLYCLLQTQTARDGINVQFSEAEPPQLKTGTPWVGGFVDPNNGSVYDLVGRAYTQNKDKSVKAIKELRIEK